MSDADAFDALVQMRGELRWNDKMRMWTCYSEGHCTRKHGITMDANPNEAVRKEHAIWLAEHPVDTVIVDVTGKDAA